MKWYSHSNVRSSLPDIKIRQRFVSDRRNEIIHENEIGVGTVFGLKWYELDDLTNKTWIIQIDFWRELQSNYEPPLARIFDYGSGWDRLTLKSNELDFKLGYDRRSDKLYSQIEFCTNYFRIWHSTGHVFDRGRDFYLSIHSYPYCKTICDRCSLFCSPITRSRTFFGGKNEKDETNLKSLCPACSTMAQEICLLSWEATMTRMKISQTNGELRKWKKSQAQQTLEVS
jgi:hypothetical protein